MNRSPVPALVAVPAVVLLMAIRAAAQDYAPPPAHDEPAAQGWASGPDGPSTWEGDEPAPSAQQAEPAPPPALQAGVPEGQWVWTQQYGWVWMPYSDAYARVPADDAGEPLMYLYTPSIG